MASLLLRDQNGAPLLTTIGYLRDQGSTFPVLSLPSKVVKYTPDNPAGIELVRNTTTPTSPGSGQWGYSNYYVYLGDTLQQGETVLALWGSTRIFESVNTLAGTSYFDVGQSDANYRTKIQKLTLTWIGAAEELQDVTISAEDLLDSAGGSSAHYSLAADNNGNPGEWVSTLTESQVPALAAVKDWQHVNFWVKCEKPQGSSTGTFSDVQLKFEGMRYKYARNTVTFSGTSFSVELPFNHYYLAIYAVYEYNNTNTKFFIPSLRWDAAQQKVYLIGGAETSVTNAKLHYIVHPIDSASVSVSTFSNTNLIPYPVTSSVMYRNYTFIVTDSAFIKCFDNSTSPYRLVASASTSGMVLYWDSPSLPGWQYSVFKEMQWNASASPAQSFPYLLYAPHALSGNVCRNVYAPYVLTWGSTNVYCPPYVSGTPYLWCRAVEITS